MASTPPYRKSDPRNASKSASRLARPNNIEEQSPNHLNLSLDLVSYSSPNKENLNSNTIWRKSCVILGFRSGGDADLSGRGLKMRVVWTINALIAASARHYMIRDVVRDHPHIEKLVVRDREGEGTVVMNLDGIHLKREIHRV